MTVLLAVVALILPHIPGVYQGPACAGHPVRPPSSFTSRLKRQQILELGYRDTNPAHYEEDHLIQLSLGGASRDPRNLWPQTWAQAQRDDRIEYDLYRRVCLHIGRPATVQQAVRFERRWKHRHG